MLHIVSQCCPTEPVWSNPFGSQMSRHVCSGAEAPRRGVQRTMLDVAPARYSRGDCGARSSVLRPSKPQSRLGGGERRSGILQLGDFRGWTAKQQQHSLELQLQHADAIDPYHPIPFSVMSAVVAPLSPPLCPREVQIVLRGEQNAPIRSRRACTGEKGTRSVCLRLCGGESRMGCIRRDDYAGRQGTALCSLSPSPHITSPHLPPPPFTSPHFPSTSGLSR